MPMDWRTAYFQQAQSDYAMLLKLLEDRNTPLCHSLHYLQMTTEKMAKGFLTRPGDGPQRTHNAFVAFVQTSAPFDRDLQSACGCVNIGQYRAYLAGLHNLAQAIENLFPDGPDHPNPEYPWIFQGVIYVPDAYNFSGDELNLLRQSPRMVKMLKFIAACFDVV